LGEYPTYNGPTGLRIGAVRYLNSKALTTGLCSLAPDAQVLLDLPSRLADRLAAGELDVALAPSIEYFRRPGYAIVSDACIACSGAARSIKLYGRVPVERVRTLAVDEGSRTSAALAQILLRERFSMQPELQVLPIGASLSDSTADAVMLIGDRALYPPAGHFQFVWDLGQQWWLWTGLPFVFAMWIARPGVDLAGVDELLSTARDEGVARIEQIARQQSVEMQLPEDECLAYLRDTLQFQLGEGERRGLELFYRLAQRHGLAPPGVDLVYYASRTAR
jgi:chorismate dehydratase